ncbi:TolC family protein [Elizabethkingia argenteiflava]|nr:TolC family protein [Elizabethkingia argenteiflava]
MLSLALLAGGFFGYAQTQRKMSLSEAVSLSIKHNSKLKITEAKLNTLNSKVREAKGNRLPNLKLSGSIMKPFNSMELKSDLPLFKMGNSASAVPQYIAVQQINMEVPIFSGFKIKSGIEIAEYQKLLQQYQLENDKQDVALAVTQVFIDLYKAKQAINVINENLSRAHQRSVDFEKLERNGVVARNDLMRVKLQESNVKLSLADAKKNVNVLNYNLSILLGEEEINIDPDMRIDEASSLVNEESLQEKALQQRQEYHMLAEQDKIGKANIDIAQSAYYPTVAFTAGYMNAWISDLLQVNHMTTMGLSLSYDLASLYKNKAATETARLQYIETQEYRKELDENIKTDIHNAYQDYLLQNEKIKVYKESVDQANENYKVVKNKFDNGLATTTDLLTADVEQLQAHINLVYGKADEKWAYFNLLRKAGEIKY